MKIFCSLLLLLFSGVAFSATDTMTFRSEAQEQQFRQLTAELRCPKCQNNSIADSNSMIAMDMRQKVYQLMQEGKSKSEIVAYMVARYGNFVTYEPPLTPLTLLLWLLPMAAIATGGWGIFARTRRRRLLTQDDALPQTAPGSSITSLWLLAAGGLAALMVSAGCYYFTGSFTAVRFWQQATAQTPTLLARAFGSDAQTLSQQEMANLALGLRTRLQHEPGSVEGWIVLGRVGMMMSDAETATQAYSRAYALDSHNSEAARGYAQMLTLSDDPLDNRMGGELLRQQLKNDHTDTRVLGLLAFNAFEQQRYHEAIAAWQMMLRLLPVDDPGRAVIERSIGQAQQLQP